MESLTENKPLFYSIAVSMGALASLLMGFLPEVSKQFELVEFPQDVSTIQSSSRVHLHIKVSSNLTVTI